MRLCRSPEQCGAPQDPEQDALFDDDGVSDRYGIRAETLILIDGQGRQRLRLALHDPRVGWGAGMERRVEETVARLMGERTSGERLASRRGGAP